MKTVFYSLILSLFVFSLSAEQAKIEVTTSPEAGKILPDLEMARLSVKLSNQKGEVIKKAKLHIVVDAPPSGAIFSTDFPIVEGTHLIDIETEIQNGVFELDYLFPIRGAYTVKVTASPLAGDSSFETTMVTPAFVLSEVPAEVGKLYKFLALLAIFGLGSGFVLGRSNRKKLEVENE
jgi:hypothetical protein